MKISALFLAFAVLGSLPAMGADPGAGGWNGASWGASEEDLLQAFPAARRHDFFLLKTEAGDFGTTLAIDDYKFEGLDFRVDFLEDKERRLVGVELVRDAGSQADFQLLERRLTQSFGMGLYDSSRGGETWSFPALQVELGYSQKNNAVTIFYLKPAREASK